MREQSAFNPLEYWYSYGVIGFTPRQNIWIFQNWECFERDDWPPLIGDKHGKYITDEYIPPDKEKGEKKGKWIEVIKAVGAGTESPIRKRLVKCEAYFVGPSLITAEIKTRLTTTKRAGETLMWEVKEGLTDIDRLSPSARGALFYISGTERRKEAYPRWLFDQGRIRKNTDNNIGNPHLESRI